MDDVDISAAAAPLTAVVAGRIVVALGVFTLLLQAQTLSNLRFASWHWLVPAVMLPVSVATIVVGWKASRARGWAAIASTILAVVIGLETAVWTVLALTWGYFSMLSFVVGIAAGLGALLSAIAIGPARRTDGARARLLAQGLDLGT